MPSPRRRPKLHRPDPDNLIDLSWAELVALAERGSITWVDVRDATRAQYLRLAGGVDVYASKGIFRMTRSISGAHR